VRVLVTGGSGFIGSHLVDLLVDEGHDVVVVDRVASEFENPSARYVLADIREPATWAGLLDGVDAISHQAARVGLGVRFADVVDYVNDNDLGTAVLLSALDEAQFTGRLVVAGSMVYYGEGAGHCERCGIVRPGPRTPERLAEGRFEPPCPRCGGDLQPALVDESSPADPRNVYAATKVHQEHLCAAFGRESGASVLSLRYHNVYGPRAPLDTPYSGVASIFMSALRRGVAPVVFEDGGQRRDFVHVRDVARANLAALCAPPGAQGAFNVASGQPATILELANALWEALGRPAPAPGVSGRWRLGDVRHIVASPERAHHQLGFVAETPLTVGMAELAAAALAS
jgi:dTDP-L-rhamnose 4-epimerase